MYQYIQESEGIDERREIAVSFDRQLIRLEDDVLQAYIRWVGPRYVHMYKKLSSLLFVTPGCPFFFEPLRITVLLFF